MIFLRLAFFMSHTCFSFIFPCEILYFRRVCSLYIDDTLSLARIKGSVCVIFTGSAFALFFVFLPLFIYSIFLKAAALRRFSFIAKKHRPIFLFLSRPTKSQYSY
jgi:hypothetical protein